MMDVSPFKSANTPADHRASYPSSIAQVYPPFALDATTSDSWYRQLESGRGVNYYTADPNLARTLATYLTPTVRRWAEKSLSQLGNPAGTELVRRADGYDAVGHVLTRYDKLGRDVSQVEHHPDWLANLDEVWSAGITTPPGCSATVGRQSRCWPPSTTSSGRPTSRCVVRRNSPTAPSPCWSASPPSSNATNCCPRSSRPASGG